MSFLLQSILQPLAPAGSSSTQPNTNLSTSISLSILNQNGQDILFAAGIDHPIEFIISRDPNSLVSPMSFQNVTSMNKTQQPLNLYFVNITQSNSNLTVSLHLELRPLNATLGYLYIYRFDRAPLLNTSTNQIDDWSLLCPSSKLFPKIKFS